MDYRNVRAISFDAAGTLIFPHPSVGEIYCEVLSKHGIDGDPEEVESRFFESFRQKPQRVQVNETTEQKLWKEIVRASLPSLEVETFERVFQELYRSFEDPGRWRTADGAFRVLEQLQEKGYRLVVLSNADIRFRTVFEGLGLRPYFEEMFLSTELGFEKPHIGAFEGVEKFLGLAPSSILHVGDSVYQDGVGAREAGWKALLVGSHASFPNISSLRELPNLLVRNTES